MNRAYSFQADQRSERSVIRHCIHKLIDIHTYVTKKCIQDRVHVLFKDGAPDCGTQSEREYLPPGKRNSEWIKIKNKKRWINFSS